MNAPARVRAYLDARYAHQDATGTHGNSLPVPWRPDAEGNRVYLQMADLEALLQTVDILARLLAAQADSTPEFVLRAADYAINLEQEKREQSK